MARGILNRKSILCSGALSDIPRESSIFLVLLFFSFSEAKSFLCVTNCEK